jgi:NADH dehydrogenase [ubiquinone] 1 alpha subcomplex assembly factor 5
MVDSITLFNTRLLRLRRDKTANYLGAHDFLFQQAAERMADRLHDIRRDFPVAVDLGCHTGQLRRTLTGNKIGLLTEADISNAMLRHCDGPALQCDPEWLPFAHGSLDLVVSLWSLHWVNDLPGTLAQIRRALKPGGLFLAIVPGAYTLNELRQSLAHAQSELLGGISPQIAPFIDVRDGGDLLQRAGFALPTADSESLTVTYENALAMMQDLRGMGENNMLLSQRRAIMPRMLFPLASQYYAQHFPAMDAPERIRATFEFVTLTGWVD